MGLALRIWMLRLHKNFTMPYSEKHHLYIRFEAFNALNHPNWATPNITFTSSSFGQVGAGGMRSCNSPRSISSRRSIAVICVLQNGLHWSPHPRRKNQGAPRVGAPNFVPIAKEDNCWTVRSLCIQSRRFRSFRIEAALLVVARERPATPLYPRIFQRPGVIHP